MLWSVNYWLDARAIYASETVFHDYTASTNIVTSVFILVLHVFEILTFFLVDPVLIEKSAQ
jgi:hypothetical protein